jgi:hypothetical protein
MRTEIMRTEIMRTEIMRTVIMFGMNIISVVQKI